MQHVSAQCNIEPVTVLKYLACNFNDL